MGVLSFSGGLKSRKLSCCSRNKSEYTPGYLRIWTRVDLPAEHKQIANYSSYFVAWKTGISLSGSCEGLHYIDDGVACFGALLQTTWWLKHVLMIVLLLIGPHRERLFNISVSKSVVFEPTTAPKLDKKPYSDVFLNVNNYQSAKC